MIDTKELRRLAELCNSAYGQCSENAYLARWSSFHTIANPSAILSLLDKVEQQEALIAELHTSIAGAVQHGEQGWQRYEAANKMCINQQAEITGLNEVIAELRKDAWQPIETAPEDGSPLLLAQIEDGVIFDVLHGHFEVIEEDENDGPWDIRDGEPWCSYVGRRAGIYFCHWLPGKEWESRWLFGPNTGYTHWMPLPAASDTSTQEVG